MPIIEVENLVKKYGPLTAVDGVSFDVNEGEIFGFLGPNGAGKTTTINVLCTLLRPTSGQARVNGYDVVSQQSQVRSSIGLIFQDPSLDDQLTAYENLKFHAILFNVAPALRTKRINEVLQMVELDERRNDIVGTFSGGMKRRLEVARGLMHYPRVLFLDEHTLGLDQQTRNHLWQYIRELRAREKVTIFLTTNYMDEAENANRIAIIDNGKIIALGSPDELKEMVGGDVINLMTEDDAQAKAQLETDFNLSVTEDASGLHFEVPSGDHFIPQLLPRLKMRVTSVSLRRPTLDDVFLKLTGRAIREEEGGEKAALQAIFRARQRR